MTEHVLILAALTVAFFQIAMPLQAQKPAQHMQGLTMTHIESNIASTSSETSPDVAIQGILDAQTAAWNRGDGVAFAKDFADDAHFVNIRGDRMIGRAAIEKIHSMIFAGPYKGSHYTAKVESITYPTADVAIADVSPEVTNFAALPPGVAVTAEGVLRTRFVFVLVKGDGSWKIASAQNTAISPVPMPVR